MRPPFAVAFTSRQITVRKASVWGDWLMLCTQHREHVWTTSWQDAYEAALGHAALHHPRQTRVLVKGE